LESSNSDSAVDFSAGSKEIFCTLPSEKAVYLDASDNQVGGFSSLAADTTPQLGGDLDVDGNAIVSASDGDIAIDANGTGMVTMTANSVTGDVIPGKLEGTNFTDSLLVGHSTTGTLNAAQDNTGVGIAALDALTSGDNNTAVGSDAGTGITTGYSNTIVGSSSGSALADGANNTLLGYVAGASLSSGGNNVYIGQTSGYHNATGSNNVGLGPDSLKGASGQNNNNNTGFGHQALTAMTTGGGNIGLGYQSGNNITSGSGNVVIGNADVSSATGDDQLSISDGEDGAVVWITGESTGNTEIAVNWNPSLSTTGKALVMGF